MDKDTFIQKYRELKQNHKILIILFNNENYIFVERIKFNLNGFLPIYKGFITGNITYDHVKDVRVIL